MNASSGRSIQLKHESREDQSSAAKRYIIAISLCFVLIAEAFAFTIPFPNAFDEAAHISYSIHLIKNHSIMPNFNNFPLYYGETAYSNHLRHPPLYYAIMKPFIILFYPPSIYNVLTLRFVNILLTYCGVLLTLLIGLRTNWNRLSLNIFALLVVTIPNLPAIAATINNDNLAIFGGCLSIFAMHNILTQEKVSQNSFLVFFGLSLASSAKFTAFLLIASFLSTAFIYLLLTKKYHVFTHKNFKLGLCLFFLSLIPYCIFFLQFGSPVPGASRAFELGSLIGFDRGFTDIRLSLPQYAIHFVHMMAANWPVIGRPYHPILLPGICLFLLSGIGWVLSTRRFVLGSQTAIDAIIMCGGAAFLVTISIHFVHAYNVHTRTGALSGIHPRYYFPLLAVLPASCANVINSIKSKTLLYFAVTFLIFLSFSPIVLGLLIL
jgi:dolichyl-phosphate-mannose--protein O-mannosyl transferase